MENELFTDMKFSRFLIVGKQIDPLMPADPLGVHLLLRLLQAYRGLGKDSYAGVELLTQDTDITEPACKDRASYLSENGLVEIVDNSAYRLTMDGLVRAANIEDLRERSITGNFEEPFPGLKYGFTEKKSSFSLTGTHWLLIIIGAVILFAVFA